MNGTHSTSFLLACSTREDCRNSVDGEGSGLGALRTFDDVDVCKLST